MKCKCGKNIDRFDEAFYMGRCVDCVVSQITQTIEDNHCGLQKWYKRIFSRRKPQTA